MGQQDSGKDPSPEEIQAMCEELQRHWTADEKARHLGVYSEPRPYERPVVSVRWLGIDRATALAMSTEDT